MKSITLFLMVILSFNSIAQKQQPLKKSVMYDTLKLSSVQLAKLSDINQQLISIEQKKNELIQKQKDILELIFDSKNIVLDQVRNLKYDNGKFIYLIE